MPAQLKTFNDFPWHKERSANSLAWPTRCFRSWSLLPLQLLKLLLPFSFVSWMLLSFNFLNPARPFPNPQHILFPLHVTHPSPPVPLSQMTAFPWLFSWCCLIFQVCTLFLLLIGLSLFTYTYLSNSFLSQNILFIFSFTEQIYLCT